MDTTLPILHALGTAQSLDLERRALGLASTAVNAMQYDLDTAPDDATRRQLVDTWWDVYEPNTSLSGATAVQRSFNMRARRSEFHVARLFPGTAEQSQG